MRIGIDAMGGDYAPLEAVKGASLAASVMADVELVLFGSKSAIEEVCSSEGIDIAQFEIVDTPDVIEMAEHPDIEIRTVKGCCRSFNLPQRRRRHATA